MQEVVDVPRLVTDPEVVRRLPHHVVEQHVVGAEDLVHPPESVEGVQVVRRGLALPVGGLRGQLSTRGVDHLAVRLQHLGHRGLGQPLDLQVGHPLAQGTGDGEVPQHVAQSDRRADPQGPTLALSGEEPRGADRGGVGRVHVDELLDQCVDQHGVPRHRQVSYAVHDDQAAAGQLGEAGTALRVLAVVERAMQDEHRTVERLGDPDDLSLLGQPLRRGEPRLQGRGVGLERPLDHVVEDLCRVGLGDHVLAVMCCPARVVVHPAGLVQLLDRRRLLGQGPEPGRDRDQPAEALGGRGRGHQRPLRAEAFRDQERRLGAGGVEHREHVRGVRVVAVSRRVLRPV